ncbi:hypothetical protein PR729_21730 [Providencia rettgeri]|nr:hypothetical protein PR729_21730 [Providencia rettgeri]
MNFFKVIIAILIFGAAFLLGALYMKPTQLSLVEQVKKNVYDVLAYPQAAKFRNIEYHFSRYTADNGKVGYVCGEVYRYKNDKPDGFKRFIVKSYTNDEAAWIFLFRLLTEDMKYYCLNRLTKFGKISAQVLLHRSNKELRVLKFCSTRF